MSFIRYISSKSKPLSGQATVPGDKSISHRSVIFGAIAEGVTHVDGFLDGEDCIATINAFKEMGVVIEGPYQGRLVIHGVGKNGLKKPYKTLDCGNSGTSIRLLSGLLAAQPFESILTGDESLLKRPMKRISEPLSGMGAHVKTNDGTPPIHIEGTSLHAIDYVMPKASAQVKSCLLLAGMYAEGTTKITENAPSRDHTERMLESFSYPLQRDGDTLVIESGYSCLAADIKIPSDISSAAFFIVAASLIPGSDILLKQVGINPTRTGILKILDAMGADFTLSNQHQFGEEPVADIHIRHATLQGIDIPPSLVPLAIDEFPIIFIAAACARGRTSLRGASELRLKESDRILAMIEGLNQLQIKATAYDDGALIEGGVIQGGIVDSHGDHRIAMAFSIAGAVSASPIIIENCAAVATSFPNFIEIATSLGMSIEERVSHE